MIYFLSICYCLFAVGFSIKMTKDSKEEKSTLPEMIWAFIIFFLICPFLVGTTLARMVNQK